MLCQFCLEELSKHACFVFSGCRFQNGNVDVPDSATTTVNSWLSKHEAGCASTGNSGSVARPQVLLLFALASEGFLPLGKHRLETVDKLLRIAIAFDAIDLLTAAGNEHRGRIPADIQFLHERRRL